MSDPQKVFTEKDCESVLRNYQTQRSLVLTSYTIQPLSDNVEGYAGEYFIVKIKHRDETSGTDGAETFFLKVINESTDMVYELTQSMNAFAKEELFYSYLLKEYHKLGIETAFAPKCYYCADNKVVLEFLLERGFKNTEKNRPFDIYQCKAVLQTLVKFHGATLAYEYRKQINLFEEFPNILDDRIYRANDENCITQLRRAFEAMDLLIDHLNITTEQKIKFRENFRLQCRNIANIVNESHKYKCTVLHSDLWSNNFLFKYASQQPEIILIDFQTIKYGTPAMDVMETILTNTRREFRESYLTELLDFYYSELTDYLKPHGIKVSEILTQKDFQQSAKFLTPLVKMFAMGNRFQFFLGLESPASAQSPEDVFRTFTHDKGEAFHSIVKSYLTTNLFKDVVEEDMLDLMEMLESHRESEYKFYV